jgi:lipopolysaccharide/colanic/teichoic acid biosynthesis glycosyltransferase
MIQILNQWFYNGKRQFKMTSAKRYMDLIFAVGLSLLLLPIIIIISLIILIYDGRPILYISERMKTPDEGFQLFKFRTMRTATYDSGVSGGDKFSRITPVGRFLRSSRLDETPQLLNVFIGDISFVGPRPPLRQYVERFPNIYSQVLKSRPGITGLASICFHSHEELLLSRSNSPSETDRIYSDACIPRKARIDIIYQENQNICFDLNIMLKTVFKSLR